MHENKLFKAFNVLLAGLKSSLCATCVCRKPHLWQGICFDFYIIKMNKDMFWRSAFSCTEFHKTATFVISCQWCSDVLRVQINLCHCLIGVKGSLPRKFKSYCITRQNSVIMIPSEASTNRTYMAATTAAAMDVFWVEVLPAKPVATSVGGGGQKRCTSGSDCDWKRMANLSFAADVSDCPPDPENVHEYIKQKVLVPLAVLIIITNLIVFFFIVAYRRFHNPTHMFLGSLVVADLFVGFVSIVTVATKANEKSQDQCLARIGVTVAAISASVWSLTCVAIDRYIAVTRALLYRAIMTKKKTLIGIAWSWSFSLLVGFLPLLGWKDRTYLYYCSFMFVLPRLYIVFIFTVSAMIPIGLMFIIYGKLFKCSRFHIKQIQTIERLQSDKRNSGLFGISTRTLRSVKTFAAVLGCVVVTCLPLILATVVQLFINNCELQEIIGTHLLVLGFSNSFLNPLIYAIGTKDFRERVTHLFRGRCYVTERQVAPTNQRSVRIPLE